MRHPAALLFAVVFFVSTGLHASERILRYDSRITVESDGSLLVTERIVVQSGGIEIRHGIYREFPTTYRSAFGEREIRGFEVVGVTRDGHDEYYRIQRELDVVRVYCGNKDSYLPSGVHEYSITYTTTRQIGFFKDFDELYWNVTGNAWAFPIDTATACIVLPKPASDNVISTAGYTGRKGEKGNSCFKSRGSRGEILFATTRPLGVNEGLTVAVSWPKKIIAEPTDSEKTMLYFSDHEGTVVLAFGILIVLLYYLAVWSSVGKDPEKGTIIPRYTPPEGLSPASMRFIRRMGYDTKTFATAILTLAVKGYLSITDDKGTYTLRDVKSDAWDIATPERTIGSKLFAGGRVLTLNQSNHEYIKNALTDLHKALKKNYEYRYFITNRKFFIPGAIMSLIVLAAALMTATESGVTMFMMVWLSVWSIGVGALLARVISSWKMVRSTGLTGMGQVTRALFATAFALPFVAGELIGTGFLIYSASLSFVALMAGLVFINYLFYRLLKAPTLAGRSLMDGIDGFRMYLSVTEKDELKMAAGMPQRTTELYEQYLPFALALDVENQWSEQFAGVFKSLNGGKAGYSPGWYNGTDAAAFGTAGFVSSFGGVLTSSISSSSGSGSGGGGSSGGGGGGGGGGGW